MEEAESPDVPNPKDETVRGCLAGCGIQAVLILACFGTLATLDPRVERRTAVYLSWCLLQWIAIVPAYRHFRATGRPNTAKGLLLQGGVGVLLGTACGAMFYH